MSYRDYQNSRDAAWRVLLDCGITSLPVDLNAICRKLGVRARPYRTSKALIESRRVSKIAAQADGLTFYLNGTPIVLYNETCPAGRIRFTVAHELGHIVLGHAKPGSATTVNREPEPGDDPIERAANQFAARLLAPACVLWGLGVHTAEDIERVCRISHQAAQFRAERMQSLYKKNKFLTSPLERRLYQSFLPFIRG